MSDEKEARGYLQALASKMTEELEGLKSSGYATIPRVCAKEFSEEKCVYNAFAPFSGTICKPWYHTMVQPNLAIWKGFQDFKIKSKFSDPIFCRYHL